MKPAKLILSAPPVVILICFFLPWITISVARAIDWQASGYNLGLEGRFVLSSENRQQRAMISQSLLEEPTYKIDEVRIATIAVGVGALAALGIALYSTISRPGYIIAGLVAGIAQVYVIVRFLEVTPREEMVRRIVEVSIQPWAWLSVAAAAAIAGLGFFYKPEAATPSVSTRSTF